LRLTLPTDQANLDLNISIWGAFSANVLEQVLSRSFDDCLRHICGSGRQGHIHIPFDTLRFEPFNPTVRRFPDLWVDGVDNGWILFHTLGGQEELNRCIQCYHQRQSHAVRNQEEWATCCSCLQELAQKFWTYQNAPDASRQFSFFEVSYENIRHLRTGRSAHAREYKNPTLHSIKIRLDRIFLQQRNAQEWYDFLTQNWEDLNYANIANALSRIAFDFDRDVRTLRYQRHEWQKCNAAYVDEIRNRDNTNFLIVTLVIGIDAEHNSRQELEAALRIIDPWDQAGNDTSLQVKINALSDLLTRMQWHVCSFYIR
jgi:hypothetical protein